MSRYVKLFSISFAGIFFFLCIGTVAVAIFAGANDWSSVDVALGPVKFVGLHNDAVESSFTMGPGLPLLAMLFASINVLLAALLQRRDAGSPPRLS